MQQKYCNVLRCGDDSQGAEEGEKDPPILIDSFQEFGLDRIDEELIEKYRPKRLIYQNQVGIVMECVNKKEEKEVAIKISVTAMKEGEILNYIQSHKSTKSIIKCIQVFNQSIVLELFRGNLKDLINEGKIDLQLIEKLLSDCISAFEVLEQLQIIHMDVKPQNILYRAQNGSIKQFVLADFADVLMKNRKKEQENEQKRSLKIGKRTWQYKAPQIALDGGSIGLGVHVWGLGCLLFQCLTGETLLPLEIDSKKDYLKYFPQFTSQEALQLRLKRFAIPSLVQKFQPILISLLKFDPSQRPSLKQCKSCLSISI